MDHTDGGCLGKSQIDDENSYFVEDRNLMEANNVTNNNEVKAVAPVTHLDYYYKMDHPHRGLLIIFNHEKFNKDTNQATRTATHEDLRKIKEAFRVLDFVIHPYTDLTLAEIRDHIARYVTDDHYHHQRDCLAVFVLTHGDKDALWAKDAWYNPAEELWGQFTGDKCPSLAGKPKLFFLQACQGRSFDEGVKLMPPTLQHRRTQYDGNFYYKLPTNADFLIFYATYEGYYAFRNDQNGSFWVTLLCDELQKHHKNTDLLSILTFVNRRLAVEFASSNSKDNSKSGKKQISYFKSSLTRLLIFGEK